MRRQNDSSTQMSHVDAAYASMARGHKLITVSCNAAGTGSGTATLQQLRAQTTTHAVHVTRSKALNQKERQLVGLYP